MVLIEGGLDSRATSRRFLETDREVVDSKAAAPWTSTDVISQKNQILSLRSYQRNRGKVLKGVNLDNQYS